MSQDQGPFSSRTVVVAYVVGSVVAIAVPALLRACAVLPGRYVAAFPLLTSFALLQSLVVCAVLYLRWRYARRSVGPSAVCFVVVSLFFLGLVVEYPARTWDWRAYEEAALSVARGGDPYTEADYLYPPVFAQAGGALVRLITVIFGEPREGALAGALFYLWQCLQFHAVLACYVLGLRFLHRVGLAGWQWTVALAALYALNVPLLRALRFSQPAAYTLLAVLLVVLLGNRHSWVAGLGVGVATYVKVFPIVLLVPALVSGQRKLLGWAAAWLALIGAASLAAPDGLAYWKSFAGLLSTFPEPLAFRDNSLPGLVRNTARVLAMGPFPLWVARLLQAAIGGWLVSRMVRRRRGTRGGDPARWFGNVSDAVCLGLVLSPTVWEHYFVFLIPGVIWAWRATFRTRPLAVIFATVLTSLVPTFDVFPLSYHRLAGLLLLATAVPLRADFPTE